MKITNTFKNLVVVFNLIIVSPNIFCADFNYAPSNFDNYYFQPQNLGTSTPHVTDFLKFGNLNINNYYGLLDTKIDIENYKDKDFEISVSLKYNSSGFRPSKRPSMVGLNWVLEFGGIITRIIKGSPDETRGQYTDDVLKYIKDGIFVAIKDGNFKIYSESDLNNCNIEKYKDYNKNPYINGDFKYDFEPDIFKYNFGKYSGSFIISNSGIPKLLEENGCKIDIDSMTIQSYNTSSTPNNSSIYITTPDGYKYSFGGNVNYFEYFIPDNPNKCVVRPRYITSWFLRSIEAPNRRKVLFTYKSNIQRNKYFNFISSISNSETITSCTIARNLTTGKNADIPFTGSQRVSSSEIKKIIFNDEIHTPIIDNIKIDNTTIRFYVDVTNQGFYNITDLTDKSIYLSKISTFYGSKNIKNTNFSYTQKNNYFFLDYFLKNELKYEFDYNYKDLMPDPLTLSIDHWGFWAGGFETETNNIGVYCANMETNRAVNTNVCDNFLLSKITYPAGGYTEIKYEYNRYNYCFDRDINTIKLNLLELNTPRPCGGSRVLSLTDCDNLSNIKNIKTFLYKDNLNNGKEIGVIGLIPKYYTYETRESYSNSTKYDYTSAGTIYYEYYHRTYYQHHNNSSNTFGALNNFGEFHISYPCVIELNLNNSFTKYSYSSLLDNPDSYEQYYKVNIPLMTNSEIWSPYSNLTMTQIAEKHNLFTTNDLSSFRGKLIRKEMYTSGNTIPVQTEIYNYNTSESKNNYNISVISSSMGYAAYKLYTIPCNLIHKEVIALNGIRIIEELNSSCKCNFSYF